MADKNPEAQILTVRKNIEVKTSPASVEIKEINNEINIVRTEGAVEVTENIKNQIKVVHTGAPGVKGDKGDNGENGSFNTYVYEAPSATTLWTVHHNLQCFPSVAIVDSAGNTFLASVNYIDINNLTISFSYPTGGKAYLN